MTNYKRNISVSQKTSYNNIYEKNVLDVQEIIQIYIVIIYV